MDAPAQDLAGALITEKAQKGPIAENTVALQVDAINGLGRRIDKELGIFQGLGRGLAQADVEHQGVAAQADEDEGQQVPQDDGPGEDPRSALSPEGPAV